MSEAVYDQFGPAIPVPTNEGVSIASIVWQVAEEHGLSVDQLRGPQRAKKVSTPRQEAMWRAYATGRFSNQQIGNYLGHRDWTTVIHGRREHAKRHGLKAW